MINNEDFKIWLNEPGTKFFIKWLKRNLVEHKKLGLEKAYNNSHKNEKNEIATLHFQVAKGIEMIIGMFEEVNYQIKEEIKARDLPENEEKPEIQDVIGEMIELVYPKKEAEDAKSQ
jgi:hypothetical protein